MGKHLGCPECEDIALFTLSVTGTQEKASFQLTADGRRILSQASTVHVDSYDEDKLECESCGAVVAKEKLEVVDAS